ncbi:MAG: extracellular solute-binding protein [Pleurocapsa minor GSE-CHR-MK-17-07R]|jgi:iron(III) transport system substrate-binding protein|nr:extracellular solute-binding protein [Pleurocapsa minor GSE-CHR-MK 17-07R]
MRKLFLAASAALGVVLLSGAAVMAQDTPQVVNVYSSRHYGAMEDAFVRFTEETGIEVRLSSGSAQSILERLRAEGSQTVADVYFTIDAGGLDLAASEGLLQPIESEILTEAIPADLRDPDNLWFAVSQRMRTIMYNPETVDPSELSTYAALADEEWAGRLCLRPGTHIYTISLIGSLIANLGAEEAERVVAGWVANQPQYIDSDTRILETIAAGGCDVGLTNHYYLARLLDTDPEFPVRAFWANQGEGETGVFRNVGGVGLTAAAINRDNAIRLIEWMATDGQAADLTGVPGGNYEFPTAVDAPVNEIIAGFGEFTIDPLPLTEYGELQIQAVELIERVGYGS